MRPALILLILALSSGCGRAQSDDSSAGHSPDGLAIAAFDPGGHAPLTIVSPSIDADGALAARQSAYGANLSPGLRWNAAPGAAAWAIILEDPDAHGPRPFVHWLIWNIPAAATSLEEGLPATGRVAAPAGALQGRNGAGGLGYFGPHPPAGTGVHRYHFQVFALDRPLDLAPGAGRDAVVAAMKGHVVAAGDLVGAYAAPGK